MKKRPSHFKKGKKILPGVFLFAALFFLIAALVLLRFSAEGGNSLKQMLSSTQLMQNAKLVKQDLLDISDELKENDIRSLEKSNQKLSIDVSVLKKQLSKPHWTIAGIVPILGQDVRAAKTLVNLSESFSGDLLPSWIELQKKVPFTTLKTEDGYDEEKTELYLDFFAEKAPVIRKMAERLSKLNLRLVDDSGKVSSYAKLAAPILAVADEHYDDLVRPAVKLLLAHPLSELKTDDGLDYEGITLYYGLFTDNMPVVKSTVKKLNKQDLSPIDKDGKLTSSLQLAEPLLSVVEKHGEEILDPTFTMLSEHPFSELKTSEGADHLQAWSSFLVEKNDAVEDLFEDLRGLDLSKLENRDEILSSFNLADHLFGVLLQANEQFLRPALQLLEEYPISSFKVGDGFDTRLILAYINFAEEKIPLIDSMAEEILSLDRKKIDPNGNFDSLFDGIFRLQNLIHDYLDYIPAVRVILADGNDRHYLFAAQNSAEIRASGGFPGSVGYIDIKDGVLTIAPFQSVYQTFVQGTSYRARVTDQEARLFTARMYTTWDVDFCPDFERVAQIWAYSCEEKTGRKVDGVISATPVIVQKMLSMCDTPITLSNGMTLDGTTATRVLQRDLYFEYKRAGMTIPGPNDVDMTDLMFAETIIQAMNLLTDDLNAGRLLDLCDNVKDCVDERILLFWMADENEQAIIRQTGWSGCLGIDPEKPQLGIFFSSEQSGKMGYFFDMIPEIGEPVVNEDGSRTYDVTVTLNNTVSEEELQVGGTWILGRNYVGAILGDLTLTAPAGGKISDPKLTVPRGLNHETYQGLDTYYVQWLIIYRENPITATFKVTTAPNVDAPLEIISTPTLTNYRS